MNPTQPICQQIPEYQTYVKNSQETVEKIISLRNNPVQGTSLDNPLTTELKLTERATLISSENAKDCFFSLLHDCGLSDTSIDRLWSKREEALKKTAESEELNKIKELIKNDLRTTVGAFCKPKEFDLVNERMKFLEKKLLKPYNLINSAIIFYNSKLIKHLFNKNELDGYWLEVYASAFKREDFDMLALFAEKIVINYLPNKEHLDRLINTLFERINEVEFNEVRDLAKALFYVMTPDQGYRDYIAENLTNTLEKRYDELKESFNYNAFNLEFLHASFCDPFMIENLYRTEEVEASYLLSLFKPTDHNNQFNGGFAPPHAAIVFQNLGFLNLLKKIGYEFNTKHTPETDYYSQYRTPRQELVGHSLFSLAVLWGKQEVVNWMIENGGSMAIVNQIFEEKELVPPFLITKGAHS